MLNVNPHEPIPLGYSAGPEHLPISLNGLFGDTVECYRQNHPDISSVYVMGTIATGQWMKGVSDLDTVGIVNGDEGGDDVNVVRRRDLLAVSSKYPDITAVDSRIISRGDVDAEANGLKTPGHIHSMLRACGVRIWGEPVELLPLTVGEAVSICTDYPEALIQKYRSGNLVESFQADPRLLVRSCSKAALRVLFSVAILRGAPYHIVAQRMADEVEHYVPEVAPIKNAALARLESPTLPAATAMDLASTAITVSRRLALDEYRQSRVGDIT